MVHPLYGGCLYVSTVANPLAQSYPSPILPNLHRVRPNVADYHARSMGSARPEWGPGQAEVLSPGPGVHARHRSCPTQVDGQSEGLEVSGPPGFEVPGGPQAGQGTRQRRRSVPPRCLSLVSQRQPEASTSGGGVWQPGPNTSGQAAQGRGGGWHIPPITTSRRQRASSDSP